MTERDWQRATAVAAVGLTAAAVALVSPPAAVTADGGGSTRLFAALAAATLVALVTAPAFVGRSLARRPAWLALAAVALGLGAGVYVYAGASQRRCTARYDGRSVLIGREWTALGETYRRENAGLSVDELLFDAAGVAERLWTRESIDRCRLVLASTYFAWMPLLAIALFATVQAVPSGLLPVSTRRRPSSVAPGGREAGGAAAGGPVVRYDVFISYRHGDPDATFARELLMALEQRGYTVAIDERDFPANASFLQEMERCIRESRHTVAILSPRYLGSGHCEEEAIVCKVLDMGDRRRRLIPMVIEPVDMPAWLYGLVGIDCTRRDPLVDPFDKLQATLGPPATVVRSA